MRLVDVEDLYCSDCECKGRCEDLMCDIKTMPAVDPVHAAGGCYCRECKRFEGDEFMKYCGEYGGLVKPDDFCSRGQRKIETVLPKSDAKVESLGVNHVRTD